VQLLLSQIELICTAVKGSADGFKSAVAFFASSRDEAAQGSNPRRTGA